MWSRAVCRELFRWWWQWSALSFQYELNINQRRQVCIFLCERKRFPCNLHSWCKGDASCLCLTEAAWVGSSCLTLLLFSLQAPVRLLTPAEVIPFVTDEVPFCVTARWPTWMMRKSENIQNHLSSTQFISQEQQIHFKHIKAHKNAQNLPRKWLSHIHRLPTLPHIYTS